MQEHYKSPPTFPYCAGHIQTRRSSEMQKLSGRRRRANLKHAKPWTNRHLQGWFHYFQGVCRVLFTSTKIDCLATPGTVASHRWLSKSYLSLETSNRLLTFPQRYSLPAISQFFPLKRVLNMDAAMTLTKFS